MCVCVCVCVCVCDKMSEPFVFVTNVSSSGSLTRWGALNDLLLSVLYMCNLYCMNGIGKLLNCNLFITTYIHGHVFVLMYFLLMYYIVYCRNGMSLRQIPRCILMLLALWQVNLCIIVSVNINIISFKLFFVVCVCIYIICIQGYFNNKRLLINLFMM